MKANSKNNQNYKNNQLYDIEKWRENLTKLALL